MKCISVFQKLLLVFLVGGLASCSKHATEPAAEPEVNGEKIDEAYSVARQIGNLKSLVLWHDGSILREEYFGTGGANNAHDVRSVTKSVTGLLVGIALDKGYIQSIDQPIGDYLSPIDPNMPSDKANIRIRHLLTMSGGFLCNELAVPSEYSDWAGAANQVQYILDRPRIAQPGQVFAYNSGALHLLSVIVSRATGRETQDFAQEALFDPLGIRERKWETDHQGYNNGAAGLEITPRDMVKIGQLVLNHGEYQGRRIVSSEWIDQMTRTQISTNNAVLYGSGYGYCWWTGQNEKGSYAFAMGWGGQFIVVVPNSNLIVVATNEWQGVTTSVAGDQWTRTINLIMTGILPAFKKIQ
jgi:CubicO group peptidase (beta-lactamase class C family)